jgi:hypothetical protein
MFKMVRDKSDFFVSLALVVEITCVLFGPRSRHYLDERQELKAT